ncbi:MAG: hypothetical protein QJR01_03565 [Kyrpidia sp.]|nr:hypothetical protein [Kyrpidia sp.]
MGQEPVDERVVVLTDEEEHEEAFRLADILEVTGRTYAILLPVENRIDSEGVIFRLDESEDGDLVVFAGGG